MKSCPEGTGPPAPGSCGVGVCKRSMTLTALCLGGLAVCLSVPFSPPLPFLPSSSRVRLSLCQALSIPTVLAMQPSLAGLKLLILPPQPPKCWNYRHVLHTQAFRLTSHTQTLSLRESQSRDEMAESGCADQRLCSPLYRRREQARPRGSGQS